MLNYVSSRMAAHRQRRSVRSPQARQDGPPAPIQPETSPFGGSPGSSTRRTLAATPCRAAAICALAARLAVHPADVLAYDSKDAHLRMMDAARRHDREAVAAALKELGLA